jgi:hypothetical protein
MSVIVDPKSGLAIPQPQMPLGGRMGLGHPRPKGYGTITYRCHTCGESIIKPWEVLFVNDTPGKDYASAIIPGKVSRGTTTHHDWHQASQQRED